MFAQLAGPGELPVFTHSVSFNVQQVELTGSASSLVLLAKPTKSAECLSREFGTTSPLCCPDQTLAGQASETQSGSRGVSVLEWCVIAGPHKEAKESEKRGCGPRQGESE